MDNIFVFVLLFASLVVASSLQRRVLYFGVVGSLVLRGGFIAASGALIDHISWVFYVFGALVLLAGARMFRPGTVVDPRRNLIVCGLRRVLPVTDDYDGGRFFARNRGKMMATPLFIALVAVETTGLMFALDSIPAVFGVTRDCSSCSPPTPSRSWDGGPCTSCSPARWTGFPTSSRDSPCCWCSSA